MFSRIKHFFRGILFLIASIPGYFGLLEQDPTFGEPPALYFLWGLCLFLFLLAIRELRKAFKKSSNDDYEEAEERKKESRQERESTPKRKTMKVWRMEYTGSHNLAPKFLDVPSENQSGRPSGVEIKEALESMGYDGGVANAIANGGSDSCWKVVG